MLLSTRALLIGLLVAAPAWADDPCTGRVVLPAMTVTKPDTVGGPFTAATWDLPAIPECAVLQGYRVLDAGTGDDLPQPLLPGLYWEPDVANGQVLLHTFKNDFDPGGAQRDVAVAVGWGPPRPPKTSTACIGDIGLPSDGVPKSAGYARTRLDCSFCVAAAWRSTGTFFTSEAIALPPQVGVTSAVLTDVTPRVEGRPFRYCASDADCATGEFCNTGPWCGYFGHSTAPICTPLVFGPGATPAATPFADNSWRINFTGPHPNLEDTYLIQVETDATVPLDQYPYPNCSPQDSSFCPLTWMLSVTYRCPDADGDGLCDDWERYGVLIDPGNGVGPRFIDLPAMGADPNKPDVFLQIDWMDCAVDGSDCTSQHSHKLSRAALRQVIEAFANSPYRSPTGSTGINLHIDQGPESIMNPVGNVRWGALSEAKKLAHVNVLGTETGGVYSWTAFDAIKSAGFAKTGRAPIFHYAIAGHNYGSTTSSGLSRGIGASDLLVTLGSFDDEVGTIPQQAGTLMHEFGHNLGLQHGGGDSVNHKPNYLSIMSYAFQLRGLRKNGHEGVLDYSRAKLGDLDETSLNEPDGVPGAANLGTRHWCPASGRYEPADPATGAIDWDCNADLRGTGVNADVNGDGACIGAGTNGMLDTAAASDDVVVGKTIYDGPNHRCDTTATGDDEQSQDLNDTEPAPLVGYDDWSHLRFVVGAIGAGAPGAPEPLPMDTADDPMTVEEAARIEPFPEPLCANDAACDDGDPCTVDHCVPANGCVNAAIPVCTVLPASTTTTTLGGPSTSTSTTTTTTTPAATTTTTTLPPADPCVGVASFAGVQCVCGQGLTPAACGTDHVSGAVLGLFQRGCGAMARAATLGKPRKVKGLVRGASGAFGRSVAKVGKAAKKHKLSAACGAALSRTLGDVEQRTRGVAADL